MAKLHFKYGAMNSGKSDTLIKTAYNYREQNLEVVTIKPSIDTKADGLIVARGGAWREVDIEADPDMDVRQAIKSQIAARALKLLSCVLVDESQFLTPKQIDQLFEVAKVDDTSVIAYGLRTDFRGNLFPGSQRLMELSDNIDKLPTMCRCGSQAEFNCRVVDGKFVFEGDQVAIDGQGEVSYNSLCGGCFLSEQAGDLNTTQK